MEFLFHEATNVFIALDVPNLSIQLGPGFEGSQGSRWVAKT